MENNIMGFGLSIRQSVFETNSSSMHSLSISENNQILEQPFDKKTTLRGWIEITGGSFGWGYEELNTPEEKLNYIFQEMNVGSRVEVMNQFAQYFKEMSGIELKIDLELLNDGYIDHQSFGLINDNYYGDFEKMYQFVVSNNSIIIDNDNH
jgi:hypothetical protein